MKIDFICFIEIEHELQCVAGEFKFHLCESQVAHGFMTSIRFEVLNDTDVSRRLIILGFFQNDKLFKKILLKIALTFFLMFYM